MYNFMTAKNKARSEAKLDRRSFLQGTLCSGLVLGAASVAPAASPVYTGSCSNASFIDALVFQQTQISQLQSKILLCFVDKLVGRLSKCQEDYSALKDLIEQLEAEICNSLKSKANGKVSEVVELGRTSMKLVQTSANQQDVKPYFAAAVFINQQLLTKAQECLPDGEITLTPKATQILKKIIAFISQQAQAIDKTVQDAQNDQSNQARVVAEVFRIANGHISAASKELVIGELPASRPTVASAALKTAYLEIGNAILKIRGLVDEDACKSVISTNLEPAVFAQAPSKFLDLTGEAFAKAFSIPVDYLRRDPNGNDTSINAGKIEPIDLVTISLEGIRRGIVKRYDLSVAQRSDSPSVFESVSYRSSENPRGAHNSAPFPGDGVWELLERHALAATSYREADLKARVLSAYGVTGAWWGNMAQKILIKNSLEGFEIVPKSNRTPPDYEPSADKLAYGLAEIF